MAIKIQYIASPTMPKAARGGCANAPGAGVLCSFRRRLPTSVLTVIVISASIVTQLAAQRTNSPIEPSNRVGWDSVPISWGQGPNLLTSDYSRDPKAGDTFSDTELGPESRLVGPLPGCEYGISIEPVYYGEVFTNSRGGISTNGATQYQALLDLSMTVDFERMRLPLPGQFFLLAQNTHGRGLTEDFVGDTLVLSDIDSFDNITHVGEYWWEFGLLDDNVTVRLGKQDVNTEFLYMDTAVDFIQSSFELTPTAALPSYPAPSMAAVVLLRLAESLQLKLGVWDAFASEGSWGISGNDIMFLVSELEYKYAMLDGDLPGTVSIGAGYLSEGEVLGTRLSAMHGYSVQFEQYIYRECTCDPDNRQGLALFTAYYPRFPGQFVLVEAIGGNFVAGLVYQGLFPQRDEDACGAGVTWAKLFLGGTNEETVVEVFYKAQITPRISVQPDLQYIATPSGIHPDALAVGVRFQVAL
jgi:porin